jgi:hypothetical protein
LVTDAGIQQWADLPRSATGKVLKERLRSEGKTSQAWDREAAGVILQKR